MHSRPVENTCNDVDDVSPETADMAQGTAAAG
jgi:hypothetical protein